MKNKMRHAVYLGIATAAAAKRFVEAEVKQYAAKGNITAKEGERIAKSAMGRINKHRVGFEKAVMTEVKRGLREARPLIKEGKKIAVSIAKEIGKEVKSKAKGKAKGAVVKVSRKIKSKVLKARSVASAAKKKIKHMNIRKRVVKKVKKIRRK